MCSHTFQPPVMAVAVSRPQQPDWTCGVCGRVWRDTLTGTSFHWAEVSGPNPKLVRRRRGKGDAPKGSDRGRA